MVCGEWKSCLFLSNAIISRDSVPHPQSHPLPAAPKGLACGSDQLSEYSISLILYTRCDIENHTDYGPNRPAPRELTFIHIIALIERHTLEISGILVL